METKGLSSLAPCLLNVLILPMRNGNKTKISSSPRLCSVLILPMRNGNIVFCLNVYLTFSFLSYLWGMETTTSFASATNVISCSYPTYEEWKPYGFAPSCKEASSSYPTYEEWKQYFPQICSFANQAFLSYLWGMETNTHRFFLILGLCSYPTYEEWKHDKRMERTSRVRVEFLSYLWGMETFVI